MLVTTAPSASFSPNPGLFAYSGGVPSAPLTIAITAKTGLAKLGSWSLDIYDPDGAPFKAFGGTSLPGRVEWNGKSDAGTVLLAATNYPATLTVIDEFGGKGSYKGSFSMSDKPGAAAPAIGIRRAGFSPTNTGGVKNTFDFLLTIPEMPDVIAWKLEVMSATKGVIRAYSGDLSNIPEFVRWDGNDEGGKLAEQGPYYSTLTVDYGAKYKLSTAQGPNFSLVVSPPSGIVSVDPPEPALAEIGPASPMHFIIQAKSAYAQIMKWTMSVLDPGDGAAVVFFQANWPNNTVDWDGVTVSGGRMRPGVRYDVVAKVEDEYGNVGTLRGIIAVEAIKPADEPSSIVASSAGFAPMGDGTFPTMDFTIKAGDAASIASWKVDIRDSVGKTRKSYQGSDSQVPSQLSWDGKLDDGTWAPEGSYVARLSIDYGLKFADLFVETRRFILDLTPPTVSVKLSNNLLSADGTGQYDSVIIGVDASSKFTRITAWSMSILDPSSVPFASFKDGWPYTPVVWDGRGSNGELVESASDYTIVVTVRDEFGNTGEARTTIPTDIMVIKTLDGYRISVASIVFKGFTDDYIDVPADRAKRNIETLDLLGKKLAKFPEYRIGLEGHAVMIFWDNEEAGKIEQEAELLPLSKRRAEAIAAALVDRGIDAARLETTGLGATNPIVPNSDLANRWKNRRVEFILLK